MNIPQKLQPWIEARKRHALSHAHIQMARELGLNPKKLGKIDNHKQEPWKAPLPEFIEEIYHKRFGRERPEKIKSIEEMAKVQNRKKQESKKRKQELREKKMNGNEDKFGVVIDDYESPYTGYLFLPANERVKITEKESEWPGFVWCVGNSGKGMWTPREYLIQDGSEGVLKRDYIATELSVKTGDNLLIIDEVSGWYWCENEHQRRGWVPTKNITVK